MKKFLFIFGVLYFVNMVSVYADFNQAPKPYTGGFINDGSSIISIKDALKLKDDSVVTLQGNIIKSLGDEKYTFKDATGEIIVDIDNDKWNGLTVQPNDVVIINGELEKDFMEYTKVDVKYITLKKVN